MDPATAAVMILLSCSPIDGFVCKPIAAPPAIFSSLDQCRAALKNRLASAPRGKIIGRCRRVDAKVTGALPDAYLSVTVTRGVTSNSYIVPHEK
ncbi:hypothetical protein [Mesorhizobium loti]|uniref:Uncharacterized protein n=1 Tax=Mesorhizobium loti R88b TaxID=935548 RepID=A0A6M7WNC4_RHILI|nr:hypothetical protein [Mesorhizobium loti]QKD03485.1 hypothetical protein EB235_19920 [Mesorhizobium loti R88b]